MVSMFVQRASLSQRNTNHANKPVEANPTMWQVTDDEKWPIKTLKCRGVSNKLCALYKECAGSPAYWGPWHPDCVSLLWLQVQRGGESGDTHTAWWGSTGGPELIRPPQNAVQLDLRYTQEEKSTWRTITLFNFLLWNFLNPPPHLSPCVTTAPVNLSILHV